MKIILLMGGGCVVFAFSGLIPIEWVETLVRILGMTLIITAIITFINRASPEKVKQLEDILDDSKHKGGGDSK